MIPNWAIFSKFPVIFPVTRENWLEIGSSQTAPATILQIPSKIPYFIEFFESVILAESQSESQLLP